MEHIGETRSSLRNLVLNKNQKYRGRPHFMTDEEYMRVAEQVRAMIENRRIHCELKFNYGSDGVLQKYNQLTDSYKRIQELLWEGQAVMEESLEINEESLKTREERDEARRNKDKSLNYWIEKEREIGKILDDEIVGLENDIRELLQEGMKVVRILKYYWTKLWQCCSRVAETP